MQDGWHQYCYGLGQPLPSSVSQRKALSQRKWSMSVRVPFPQLPRIPAVWAWRKDFKDGQSGYLLNQEPGRA